MMGRTSPDKTAASCLGCFAWGQLPGRYCHACYTFGRLHSAGCCTACGREFPVKKGYCRLCWSQASMEAKDEVTVLQPYLEKLTHQQLFFTGMHRIRQPGPLMGKQGRRGRTPPLDPIGRDSTAGSPGQIKLDFEVRRDYSTFNRRDHADLSNPVLIRARRAARTMGEARGWSRRLVADVDRAMVILLACHHDDGDRIRFSELFPVLRRYRLSVERAVEVLDQLGLVDDDRTSAFDAWLQGRLACLSPGIRGDVENWLRTLHNGSPRSRSRSLETVRHYLNRIDGGLHGWSQRYAHLREVTRDDVLAAVDQLHGNQRYYALCALRSLFRHCKKTRSVFRDPTVRIRMSRQDHSVLQPLQPGEVEEAVVRAVDPMARLALAMAAVHAARTTAIRHMRLEDVDLGNRRLVIAGRLRPLDELTRQMLLEWFERRRARWPDTANPHLIVNQQTAVESGPVSKVWLTAAFRGLNATLERLCVDRQLDEALARGPDPLHLATVFGLDEKTAIRYANAAQQLLESAAEQHDELVDHEPKDQNRS